MAVGDFNSDGRPDLIVSNGADVGDNGSLFLGNGDGTFEAKVNYATVRSPRAMAVGDFMGNGKLDVATTNTDGTMSILLKTQDTFSVATSLLTPNPTTKGKSATATVMATSVNGFNGSVALNCVVPPTPANAPTCSLDPVSVQPPVDGSATSTLTINTVGPSAALARPSLGGNSQRHYALWLAVSGLAVGVVFVSGRSGRKKFFAILCTSVLVGGFATQVACGGGSGGTRGSGGGGNPGTPGGAYSVKVTAISGNLVHTNVVTVVVQ